MGGQNMFLWIVQLVMFAGLGLGQLRLRCLERRRLHLVSLHINQSFQQISLDTTNQARLTPKM